MIIVYRTSWFSYFVGRILVRVKNIGLVNIVAGDKIVPEILQSHLTPHRLASEALKMLEDEKYRTDISERLSIVKEKLGTKGASARVAEVLLSMK